jgi:hypothetical protein
VRSRVEGVRVLSERQRNELIGRTAMLVLAGLLLAGGIGLIRSGIAAHREENAFYEQRRLPHTTRRREARIGPLMVIGGVLLSGAGIAFLKPALLPHRNLDKRPPKPPTLWENPWDHY